MSLLKEIHEQPEWVRLSLFGLSCVVVLSIAVYVWFAKFERDAYVALNPESGAQRHAEVVQARPNPVTAVRKGVDSAAANIGEFIGLDASKGFDIGARNDDTQAQVYLLPLSD